MNNRWEREYTVASSLCDAQGILGIRPIFDIYMDMASEHAAHLGVGCQDMLERRCFWVVARTRVRLYDRPPVGELFFAETWPGKAGLAKCERYYRLRRGDKLISEGRTEWAVQDVDTGSVRRTDSFGYPAQLVVHPERVCGEPFTRFRDRDVTEMEPVRVYTVDPMDIDMGHHMNNVAYIRMLLGTFSTTEQAAMPISEVEISYRRACFEGERLSIYRWWEDGWRFEVRGPSGEAAVYAALRP